MSTTTVERNYRASSLSVVICFGNFGLLERLKILFYLLKGGTCRFSGTAVQSTQAKDIKEVP